jgi:hypothetical protein
MPIPGLKPSPRTTVFRAIILILKNSPVLRTAIKPEAFRSWTGASHDNIEFTKSLAPALRFTPTNGPEGFLFPDAQVGDLFINVEMLVQGTNVDDAQNLWWAIERAIYPGPMPLLAGGATTNSNIAALQLAGANTGLVLFSSPVFDPEPADQFFACQGQMKVAVRLQLNT